MTDTLIPKGFKRIAESDMREGIGTAYYNPERAVLMFKINDQLIGPFEVNELVILKHVLDDVVEMKGRYGSI